MSKITYTNKVDLTTSSVAAINKTKETKTVIKLIILFFIYSTMSI